VIDGVGIRVCIIAAFAIVAVGSDAHAEETVGAPAERPEWKVKADGQAPMELEIGYRFSSSAGFGSVTSFHFQPSLFFWRRMVLGARFAMDPVVGDDALDSFEFDFYAGYQHFLTDRTVPYIRALIGATQNTETETDATNYGGEVGVKLYRSKRFYFTAAAGASRSVDAYATIGIGMGLTPGHGGGNLGKGAIFIPILVGVVAAMIPYAIDRSIN
jgi:hypothetical protein